MINFKRVFAMVIRHVITTRHNFDRISDMVYWPLLDLILFGLTGLYFAKLNNNNPNTVTIILTGVIFWWIVWRGQYEISVNMMSEIWDANLVNIFVAPLKISEWIMSFVIFGILKMIISLSLLSLLAFFLYRYLSTMYGLFLAPIALNLLTTGFCVGFVVSGLLIYFGKKMQTLAWVGGGLLMPFSAVFYPVSILPAWAQKVTLFVPSSHMFEGMRQFILTGNISYEKFAVSFALNVVYLVLSVWFFTFMFNKSKKLGLGRLI